MRIVEDTPERLVLHHHPRWLVLASALVLALILYAYLSTMNDGDQGLSHLIAGIGLAWLVAALVLIQRTRATFDRRSRQITIRRQAVLRRSVAELPFAAVRRAEIQSRVPWFNRRLRKVHRAALELTDGNRVPLSPHYSEGPGSGRAVQAINRWLRA